MPISLSQLKCRVSSNLYNQTMVDLYGISACSQDYPAAEFLDDMLQISLRSSGRDCRTIKPSCAHQSLSPTQHMEGCLVPGHPSIIVNYGTSVPLPISSCTTCPGNTPC